MHVPPSPVTTSARSATSTVSEEFVKAKVEAGLEGASAGRALSSSAARKRLKAKIHAIRKGV